MDLGQRLMIATPAHDGKVSIHYASCMADTIRLGGQIGITVVPVFLPGEALVHHARNVLMKIAYEAQVDILFIDSDQGWNAEWVFELLKSEKDFIGLPVRKKSEDEAYNVKLTRKDIISENGLMDVDGIGTGFLLLTQKAVKTLWDAASEYTSHGEPYRLVFDNKIKNGELISEDIVLCNSWQALGGSVWANIKYTCNHVGTKVYGGNFENFLDRVNKAIVNESDSTNLKITITDENGEFIRNDHGATKNHSDLC